MPGSRLRGKARSTCRTLPKAERALIKRRPKPTSFNQPVIAVLSLEGIGLGPELCSNAPDPDVVGTNKLDSTVYADLQVAWQPAELFGGGASGGADA